MYLYHVFGPLFFGNFCPSFFVFCCPSLGNCCSSCLGIVVPLFCDCLSLFGELFSLFLEIFRPSFFGRAFCQSFFGNLYTSFVRIVIPVFCEFVSLFQVRLNSSGDQVRFRRRFRRRSGRLWCRARSGWEALVQSQVRFNRVPEKVPEKVWHP